MVLNIKAVNAHGTKTPNQGASGPSYLSLIRRMASIVLDDSTTSLRVRGGEWTVAIADRFFGGSSVWPQFAAYSNSDTGIYGTLDFTFQGTLLHL